jgi:hypothetical protein
LTKFNELGEFYLRYKYILRSSGRKGAAAAGKEWQERSGSGRKGVFTILLSER